MKYHDIIAEPKTAWGLNDRFWNAFTARQVSTSTFSKKIPVQGLTMCWTCRKDFMGEPFVWYCSDKCEGIGDMQADNWRQE